MAWNTDFTRFKSADLAGLDCGSYLKIPRRDRVITKVAQYTGDLEKGQCVAMIRVPAGARITGARLAWQNGAASVLSVGDPYACGRLLGPISAVVSSGVVGTSATQGAFNCLPWGACGVLTKTGRNGDGCGLFYQYTCETDIIITNNDHAGQAMEGGFQGGGVTVLGPVGTKWTGGTPTLVLEVSYLQAS